MRTQRWMVVSVCVAAMMASHPARAMDEDEDGAPERIIEGAEVHMDAFERALSRYGQWVTVAGVGRVWRPNVEAVGTGFRPYVTHGHWVYTDAGWTFKSDYKWGWAPFHYGYWWVDPVQGWVWLPAAQWAPAWVEWRYGGGNVGWSPLPPPGLNFEGSLLQGSSWTFVPTKEIASDQFQKFAVPQLEVRTVLDQSTAAPMMHVKNAISEFSPGPPSRYFRAAAIRLRAQPVMHLERVLPPPYAHASPLQLPSPPLGHFHWKMQEHASSP